MDQMFSCISYRKYEINVFMTEQKQGWKIAELKATWEGITLHPNGFDLDRIYVGSAEANEAGQSEGRRMVDAKLAPPDGHA